MKHFVRPALLLTCLTSVLLAGCSFSYVRGAVHDVDGEVLPGVAVTVEGTDWQDVTDAHGEYQVRYKPGHVVLDFAKTGFAPAQLSLDVDDRGRFTAETVSMWRLPDGQGVYLLANGRYTAADPIEPERFFLPKAYGSRRAPEAVTTERSPHIVCLKMPHDGARLSRLEKASVALGDWNGQVAHVEAWVASNSTPVDLRPLDEPAELLEEVRLPASLEPGVYALHWGALDGYDTIDTRMFAFRVVAPDAPPEAQSESPDEAPPQETDQDTEPPSDADGY